MSAKQKRLPKPRRPRRRKSKAAAWPPRRLLLPSLAVLRKLSEPVAENQTEPPERQTLLFRDAEV